MAFKQATMRQFKGKILNDDLFTDGSKFKYKQNTPVEPEYPGLA